LCFLYNVCFGRVVINVAPSSSPLVLLLPVLLRVVSSLSLIVRSLRPIVPPLDGEQFIFIVVVVVSHVAFDDIFYPLGNPLLCLLLAVRFFYKILVLLLDVLDHGPLRFKLLVAVRHLALVLLALLNFQALALAEFDFVFLQEFFFWV